MKLLILAMVAGLSMLGMNAYADDASAVSPTQAQSGEVDQAKAAGAAFLAKNKTKPDVKTTKDGLQYKILKAGHGQIPTITDVVEVDYEGKLLDGTVFDSSYQRGQSAIFAVSGVIPGWTEALQMMPVGSTWEVYIPSDLAYGEQGAPPSIGPNETLIFKVHLISIQKQ